MLYVYTKYSFLNYKWRVSNLKQKKKEFCPENAQYQ